MTTPIPAWQGNWNERILRQIRRFGSETILEFLDQFPGETYSQVADRLGDDVAPAQLQRLQFSEAKATGQLRQAAMDALVRVLKDTLPRGWNPKEPRNSAAICAFGAWGGMVESEAKLIDPDVLLAVWRAIEALVPGEGWVPQAVGDPLLQEAFKRGWP